MSHSWQSWLDNCFNMLDFILTGRKKGCSGYALDILGLGRVTVKPNPQRLKWPVIGAKQLFSGATRREEVAKSSKTMGLSVVIPEFYQRIYYTNR